MGKGKWIKMKIGGYFESTESTGLVDFIEG